MARTTPELVGGIIKVKSGDDLAAFIETADQLFDDVCLESDYSDKKAELIVRWLSGHFYSVYAPRVAREGATQVFRDFERIKAELGLNSTKYGQQVLLLDTDGNLARLNKDIVSTKIVPKKVRLTWLGTEYE